MLGPPYHRHGNVSYEHGPLEGVVQIELFQGVPDLVGGRPDGGQDYGLGALCTDRVRIRPDLFRAFGEADTVNDNCKGVPLRGGRQKNGAKQKGGKVFQ